jgi:hypothetical protein
MPMSKKDMSKAKANLKAKIDDLEAKCRMDPLKKKYPREHEELAKYKKELESL